MKRLAATSQERQPPRLSVAKGLTERQPPRLSVAKGSRSDSRLGCPAGKGVMWGQPPRLSGGAELSRRSFPRAYPPSLPYTKPEIHHKHAPDPSSHDC